MRLEQFEYIKVVAELGSMNEAAKYLHVSQQNVSKSIKQLENELQVQIFNRSKKGVILTQQGNSVYQFAKKQIEQYQQLKNELYKIQLDNLQGELTICTMNSGSSVIIPQMLCEFYKNYPNVKLHIIDSDVHGVIKQVKEKKVDFGIITYSNLEGEIYPHIPEQLHLTPLLRGEWYYWVAKDSYYAKQGFITLEQANQATVLLDEAMDVSYLRELFIYHGLDVKIGRKSKNLYLLGQLVANHQGVLPDMKFRTGEFLYAYALENQPGITTVPAISHLDHAGVGYLLGREERKDFLMKHTLNILNSISEREDLP